MINHRGYSEHGVKEFALVKDANGQLVEDNGGSGLKTAAKVGLGAAGAAGLAVGGTRAYHTINAVKAAGRGSFIKGAENAATVNSIRGDGYAERLIGARAQATARQGWMGKLGKVGNVLTKFSADLKPALRELAARSEGLMEFGDDLEMRAKAASRSMYKAKAKAGDVAQSKDWFMRHPEAIPGNKSAGDAQLPSGGKTALMGAGLAGLGVWNHKLMKNDPFPFFRHLPKSTMAGGLLLAGVGAERLRQERQRKSVSELAARSGRIVELAMIRDASGQYVEVPDRGNGLKVGAGVVAAGALGYGAYKGHNAVVGKHESKLVDAGAEKYVNNTLNGSMPADFAKGAAKNDAAKMGAFAKVKGAYGNLAQEGVAATKGAAAGGLGFLKKLSFLKKAATVV
jgi:hypothetical protein